MKKTLTFFIVGFPAILFASSTDDEIIKRLEFFKAYELLEATTGSNFNQWSQPKENPNLDGGKGKKGMSYDDSMDN